METITALGPFTAESLEDSGSSRFAPSDSGWDSDDGPAQCVVVTLTGNVTRWSHLLIRAVAEIESLDMAVGGIECGRSVYQSMREDEEFQMETGKVWDYAFTMNPTMAAHMVMIRSANLHPEEQIPSRMVQIEVENLVVQEEQGSRFDLLFGDD